MQIKIKSVLTLVLFFFLASCTPRQTPLPAEVHTPIVLPTIIPTATRVLSNSSPRLSQTVNPPAFKPGDPTATPPGSDITDPDYIAGVAAYYNGRYEEVIHLMNNVIAARPDLAPPYRFRAKGYYQLKDFDLALIDLEKALSIIPDFAIAMAERGYVKSKLGDHEGAYEDYTRALEIDPSLAMAHHNLGSYYGDSGDHEKAAKEFSLSVAIDPNRAEAWMSWGDSLISMGRFAEAVEKANKALEIKPELWKAYLVRANGFVNMEMYDSAVADYKLYIEHNKEDSVAWYNYGIGLKKSGDLEGGLAAYTKSLELDPDYPAAHINRGIIYQDLKRYDEALDDFNEALKAGDILYAYLGRGRVYADQKDYDKAIADFEKSMRLAPNDAGAYCSSAFAYFELGRFQESVDAARIADQLEPGCGGQGLYEVQARAYYALENFDEALYYIEKAMDMGPFITGFYYHGIILQAAGKNKDALDELYLFIGFAEDKPDLASELADARERIAVLNP